MRIGRILRKTLPLIAFALLALLVMYNDPGLRQKVTAYQTSCPEYMTDPQCYEFLKQQAAQIEAQKQSIEASISAEEFEQLNLYEQISYLDSAVKETKLKIAEKEVAVEKKNVEVRMLGEEILELQNSIDTLTQEITALETTMKKRTKSSYKLTFMSPLEVLLDSHDFENLMRRMKYLIETKKKDRELLADMHISKTELNDDEESLALKRADVQAKRNDIEEERAELAEERKTLESQKSQQQVLLAESETREQEFLGNLSQTNAQLNAMEAQILAVLTRMAEKGELVKVGPVSKGTMIGRMGNTGLSFGAHLHFSINDNPNASCSGGNIRGVFCGTVSPWAGYLRLGPDSKGTWGGLELYYIYSGSYQVPLDTMYGYKPYITQDFHQGLAVDMSTGIEGTPVRAVSGGDLVRGVDGYGGKYAIIYHPSGLTTVYLHLQ